MERPILSLYSHRVRSQVQRWWLVSSKVWDHCWLLLSGVRYPYVLEGPIRRPEVKGLGEVTPTEILTHMTYLTVIFIYKVKVRIELFLGEHLLGEHLWGEKGKGSEQLTLPLFDVRYTVGSLTHLRLDVFVSCLRSTWIWYCVHLND